MSLKNKLPHSILIIDDDQDILDLLEESLKDLSFKVFTASNGEEALKFLSERKVDCIVSDISMPIMNGPEFIKKLRDRLDFTPFFFITGYYEFPREDLNSLRPMAIIFKPFDFEEVAILVKNRIMSYRPTINF